MTQDTKTKIEEGETNWHTENPDGKVEFTTKEKYHGIIPSPDPSHKHLPDWYKDLSLKRNGEAPKSGLNNNTIKACVPFLEAMKQGWIMKAPSDISLTVRESEFNYGWNFESDEPVMEHFPGSMVGYNFPKDVPLLKIQTFWQVRVPDGYSVMQMPLANRYDDDRMESFFGFVDCDQRSHYMKAVLAWTGGDFDGIIEKGTPLFQFIPIDRNSLLTEATARVQTEDETEEQEKYLRAMSSKEGYYRNEIWESAGSTSLDIED